jgi:predicted lipoprotein
MLRILLAVLLAPFVATAATAEETKNHYALVQAVLEKYVVPHVTALKDAAAPLPTSVDDVCKTGKKAARKKLDSDFAKTVKAYAGVEFLRFGPLAVTARRERLSFWPDPRGIMNRQLRQILLAKDMTVAAPQGIVKQSVAIQGLPALEFLLTDETSPLGPGDDVKFRCALAAAIASNVATITRELADDWTKSGGWKDKMLRPGSDNDMYKEPTDSAGELLKAFLTGTQLVADLQLKPQLTLSAHAKGPFAKSGLPKAYYKAAISSLRDYYNVLDLESYLVDDKAWVKNWVAGAWRAIEASDGYGGASAKKKRADAPPVREVFDKITGIRKLAVGELSIAAGLAVGFNELDGD